MPVVQTATTLLLDNPQMLASPASNTSELSSLTLGVKFFELPISISYPSFISHMYACPLYCHIWSFPVCMSLSLLANHITPPAFPIQRSPSLHKTLPHPFPFRSLPCSSAQNLSICSPEFSIIIKT